MMPSSRKGKNRKIEDRPLAITPRLARLLRQQAKGRAAHDRLLDRIPRLSGRFRPIAKSLGLGPEVTPYALRHRSIARMLLKGVPTRVVAAHHDTSVAMIEKNYSRYIIGDPSEAHASDTIDLGAFSGSADGRRWRSRRDVETFTDEQRQAIGAVCDDWPDDIDWPNERQQIEAIAAIWEFVAPTASGRPRKFKKAWGKFPANCRTCRTL
jgi:hypothetical protein